MIKSKVKIEGYEVFPDGTVKLSALMKHMQQAACDDLDQFGATYANMRGDDLVFVIIKMGIAFKAEIKKGDEIEIMTLNTDIQGIVFIREFVIYKSGLPVAQATTHWVLMSYSKRIPVRPSMLKYTTTNPEMALEGVNLPRKLLEEMRFESETEHRVVFSELDENSHMNNTVYADLIYDYAPYNIEKHVKTCRIYYNGEARLGDILNIKVKKTESGHIVSCVNKESGKSCFEAKISFA
ncbi:MAG: thioesterase [Eubacteriales bacterium]|nr:thioesterase [Eubacteriales bacterium]